MNTATLPFTVETNSVIAVLRHFWHFWHFWHFYTRVCACTPPNLYIYTYIQQTIYFSTQSLSLTLHNTQDNISRTLATQQRPTPTWLSVTDVFSSSFQVQLLGYYKSVGEARKVRSIPDRGIGLNGSVKKRNRCRVYWSAFRLTPGPRPSFGGELGWPKCGPNRLGRSVCRCGSLPCHRRRWVSRRLEHYLTPGLKVPCALK